MQTQMMAVPKKQSKPNFSAPVSPFLQAAFSNLRWKKEWGILAALGLGLRTLYTVFGVLILRNGGPAPLGEDTYALISPYLHTDWFSRWFVNPWFQWDTLSYMEISILGYNNHSSSIAYMPLYPFLMRLIAPLVGNNHLAAALLISSLCFIAMLILLYELIGNIYDSKLAMRTVLAFLVFPTTFFMLAGYTEALFLALVLGYWLAARLQRWGWAALLASLATLTRLQGVILTPILLWIMFSSLIPNLSKKPIQQLKQALDNQPLLKSLRLSWIFLTATPVLVTLGYQAWLKLSGLGSVVGALDQYWRITTVAPWTGFYLFLQRLFTMKFIYMDWIDLFLLIFILLISILSLRDLPIEFSLYIWLTLAILFMRGTPPHLLASFSRYFLALFPIFILPANIKIKSVQVFAAALSLSLQMLLAWVFLLGSWVA
jgi:hypothetical protein